MKRHTFPSLVLVLVAAATLFGCSEGIDGEEPIEIDSVVEPYDEAGIAAWGDAFETRDSGKADNTGCSGVVVPDQTGFAGRVALTFDDGPEPASTSVILDVLALHEIKATFFINGKRVTTDEDRELLQRIVREGHILANHSQNHKNLGVTDLARVEQEVDQTHELIESAGVTPTYFRFPFGNATCATADLVRTFGYRVTGWHVDSADWCFASSRGGVGHCDERTFRHVPDAFRDDMAAFVMDQVHRKDGGIVLFHDVHMNTANKLDELIIRMKEAEFSFVGIDDVSTFPALNGADLNDFPWVGSQCEETADCDFGDATSCHTYTNDAAIAGFCTMACNGYCEDFPGRASTFCVSLDDGESGSCVSKSSEKNGFCADIPGTEPTSVTRFVGTSSAPASTATACLPTQ